MTPSSKAKVLADAELDDLRPYLGGSSPSRHYRMSQQLLATIDALKAELALKTKDATYLLENREYWFVEAARLHKELALKDKVVGAARELADAAQLTCESCPEELGEEWSEIQNLWERLEEFTALNDLDKVMAR